MFSSGKPEDTDAGESKSTPRVRALSTVGENVTGQFAD